MSVLIVHNYISKTCRTMVDIPILTCSLTWVSLANHEFFETNWSSLRSRLGESRIIKDSHQIKRVVGGHGVGFVSLDKSVFIHTSPLVDSMFLSMAGSLNHLWISHYLKSDHPTFGKRKMRCGCSSQEAALCVLYRVHTLSLSNHAFQIMPTDAP